MVVLPDEELCAEANSGCGQLQTHCCLRSEDAVTSNMPPRKIRLLQQPTKSVLCVVEGEEESPSLRR